MSILIGSQTYPAWQAYHDQPGELRDHLAAVLRHHAAAGFDAWEQSLSSDDDLAWLTAQKAATGLKVPSIYVGARLHGEESPENIERILASARRAKALGATTLVCNPDPCSWGGPENKTDAQIRTQLAAFNRAAEGVHEIGLNFAYHWHDPEMRCGARELWHMLLNTDPKLVGICFDTHWCYRGAGNSEVAMLDLLDFLLPRIRTFHIRQSHDGVWAETFGEGDIDYRPWAARLKKTGWSGPVYLEQAREEGTPRTMDFLEAETVGLRALRSLLE